MNYSISTLNNLTEEWTVELLRISEHGGRMSKDIADDLARAGAEQLIMGPQAAVGISYTEIKKSRVDRGKRLQTSLHRRGET